jgi:predicted nucleic acid-binding protein
MKVFLDTNILLDVLNDNRPSWKLSSIIMEEVKVHRIEAVVTAQSIVDSHYIAPKSGTSRDVIDSFAQWLSNHVNVRPITVFEIISALRSGLPDFEDAVQVCCAEAEGCDVFVTNDKQLLGGNYGTSMLLLTPQQFVDKMRRQ